jgi:AraC-like DNA-binding protein
MHNRKEERIEGVANELGLAEVALRVWFSDQSQFSSHFKRIVGVTPRRVFDFRKKSLKVRKPRQEIGRRML